MIGITEKAIGFIKKILDETIILPLFPVAISILINYIISFTFYTCHIAVSYTTIRDIFLL
jgi:hypothetical protein